MSYKLISFKTHFGCPSCLICIRNLCSSFGDKYGFITESQDTNDLYTITLTKLYNNAENFTFATGAQKYAYVKSVIFHTYLDLKRGKHFIINDNNFHDVEQEEPSIPVEAIFIKALQYIFLTEIVSLSPQEYSFFKLRYIDGHDLDIIEVSMNVSKSCLYVINSNILSKVKRIPRHKILEIMELISDL